MNCVYVVVETTEDDTVVYPTTFASYEDACNAIKARWMDYLEEERETNGLEETADKLWSDVVNSPMHDKLDPNRTRLYIEKGNHFDIYMLPVPCAPTRA